MSEKETQITQLKAELQNLSQNAQDEQALQREIKNLASLMVDKDKNIAELKAKISKYEK